MRIALTCVLLAGEERLRKLFLGASRRPIEQASAIFRAGVRYDIRFPHISAPLMLPLEAEAIWHPEASLHRQ